MTPRKNSGLKNNDITKEYISQIYSYNLESILCRRDINYNSTSFVNIYLRYIKFRQHNN